MNQEAIITSHGSVDRPLPWYKRINIEPTIFLVCIVFGLLLPITSLFLFYARCVEIFAGQSPNGDIRNVTRFCMDIQKSNNTKALNEVDADVATMRIYMQLGNSLAAAFMAPVMGAWADFAGRKKPLLMVLVGFEFYVIAEMLGVYFYDRFNVFYVFLSAEVVSGLCGGIGSLMSLSLAIVSDDARAEKSYTPSSVPLRVVIACAFQSLGVLLGSGIVSLIELFEYDTPEDKIDGYLVVFGLSCLMATAAFLYTIFFMKDSYKTVLETNEQTALLLGLEPTMPLVRKNFISSIIDSMSSVFRVAFMPRVGWTRLCLNLCILFVMVEFFAYDTQITCLYVKRPPFEWSDSMFTNFMLSRFIAVTLGMVLIPVIIRKTSLIGKESYMILIGIASGAISNTVFAVARSSAGIFATVPFSFFGGAISTGYRTLLPKLVPQEQTARLFSLVSLVLIMCPLISAFTLNNIYRTTVDFWPGLIFVIQAALFTAVFFGQLVVHFLLRPLWQRENMFDGTEALLPNPYDEEEEEEEQMPRPPPLSPTTEHRESNRSVSEEALADDTR